MMLAKNKTKKVTVVKCSDSRAFGRLLVRARKRTPPRISMCVTRSPPRWKAKLVIDFKVTGSARTRAQSNDDKAFEDDSVL